MNQVTQHRKAVMQLEQAIRQLPNQVEPETRHYFADGMYCREMRADAGIVLVGKIHKRSCVNLILQGEVEVRNHDGNRRIVAPAVFVSPAGSKRAMYVIRDLIWVTAHATSATDPEAAEFDLIAETFDALPQRRVMTEDDL